jgi:uncharacterized protein
MDRSRIGGVRLLLCLAAWPLLGGAVVGGTILGLRLAARAWARAHAADVAAIALLEAYLALLVSLAVCFGGRAGLTERLGFRLRATWHLALAPAGWFAAFVVGTVATLGVAQLTKQQPKSNAVDVLKISFDPLFVALIVPTVALLAPACEELLFRGAIFGWLRGRVPLAAAVAISAALFAGAHLVPPLFPYLFAFGVTAALIYQYTGSTMVTFVMHAGQNTLAVAAAYYAIVTGKV